MIDFFFQLAQHTWALIAEMAPYLLFGFAIAGALHTRLRPEQVQRLLGKPGIKTILKACLIGVPLPLCSCAVIPVAASLRKNGASRGATAAFLSSTPQTGVDSILATYALLGPSFTAIRVVIAFISGIVSGFLIDFFCKEPPKPAAAASPPPISPPASLSPFTPVPSQASAAPSFSNLHLTPPTAPKACGAPKAPKPGLHEALRYGFISLPANLAGALLLGLLLAGLITTVMPDDLFHGHLSSGPLAFLFATAISLPLYVCATASIPLAFALIATGLSPGAALVFLIAGPATNVATIATVWKLIGPKPTCIYLGSLLAVAWLAGALLNSSLHTEVAGAIHHHASSAPSLWQHACAAALLSILLYGFFKNVFPKKLKRPACCHG